MPDEIEGDDDDLLLADSFSSQTRRSLRVLAVEDDRLQQLVLKRLFKTGEQDHVIEFSNTAEEALEALRKTDRTEWMESKPLRVLSGPGRICIYS